MFNSLSFGLQSLEKRLFLSHSPGIDGIGVLGDSYSDEYQFYAPDRSTARNWVEQLAQDSNVSFGPFSTIDPPGAQNEGFGYNWAVSGATSTDMIANGQHTGVAAQVASGKVDLVTLFVGGNDFRDVYTVLATQGPGPATVALQAAVPTILGNIATAAGTILSPQVLAANPDAHLILTTLPKLSYLPEVRNFVLAVPAIQPFVDAVDGAIGVMNQFIQGMAAGNNRIAVADFSGMVDAAFAQKKFKVGNVDMDLRALSNPNNDPSIFVLADGLHQGTVGQGLLANLFVQTANAAFGTRIDPLSTHDILQNAGLKKDNSPSSAASQASPFSSGPSIAHHCIDDLFAAA